MKKQNKLKVKYLRLRSRYWRTQRLLFPSPAELQFIKILGGKFIRFPITHRRTGFPFAVVFSLGKVLRNEGFKREVRAGRFWIDLANDVGIGFEIQGKMWHTGNVLKEQFRYNYLSNFCVPKCRLYCRKHLNIGLRIMYIDAKRLWTEPDKVKAEVLHFLFK